MSWVAKRQTKRGEDLAYCMLGLFDVNMPLLYGEGKAKAFFRLQSEILKTSYDDSIFAWNNPNLWSSGLLAYSPHDFVDCENIKRSGSDMRGARRAPSLTSLGVEMELPILDVRGEPARSERIYSIPLNCVLSDGLGTDSLVLNIQFCRDYSGGVCLPTTGLIMARRTNVAQSNLSIPEHPTLEGETMHQVYFPLADCPKSSSWRNIEIEATSWAPAYDKPPDFASPIVNIKLGHSLFHCLGGIRFYQDFSHLHTGPQRIQITQGTDVTLSSNNGEHPCGLLIGVTDRVGTMRGGHILLRWCIDSIWHSDIPVRSFIEILRLEKYDPEDVKTQRGIRLSPKDYRTLLSDKPVKSNRKSDNAKILSRDRLRQGDVFAYEMSSYGYSTYTLWVSFIHQQEIGDKAKWTIQID